MPAELKGLDLVLAHLRDARGVDFDAYKRSTVERRVKRRMEQVGVGTYDAYRDYLEVTPTEPDALFDAMLINVTSFFRDDQAWEYLISTIVPSLLEGRAPSEPIRVWSAGCASGEEAYSLAMVFAEALGRDSFAHRVKIYATDIDDEALVRARSGVYTEREVEPVSDALRQAYMDRDGDRYVIRPDIRRCVIFGKLDLTTDAPISRIDLLACRNTLMYFTAEAQADIASRFHFALRDDGVLFLGRAEMLFSTRAMFSPIDLKRRVFAKLPSGVRGGIVPAMISADGADDPRTLKMREAALDAGPIAEIVVDAEGRLAFANEKARRWLGIVRGDVGRAFPDLQVSYRPVELRSRIEQVDLGDPQSTDGVRHVLPSGEEMYFDVDLFPLIRGGVRIGVKISFTDVTSMWQLKGELEESRQMLETTNEELQSSVEELETTNEELQSSIEELETTNEEMQSTNEELETMNEELQSSNEQLRTVNDELRERTDELDAAHAWIDAVLGSLHAAVIVVDTHLRVGSWNEWAEELWGVRAAEAVGRELAELDIGLPVEELRAAIVSCLSGSSGMVSLDAVNRRGRPIRVRVSLSPMRNEGEEPRAVLLIEEIVS